MRRRMTSALLASVASIGLALAPVQNANAFILGGIVYDPTNYAQNLLTAARTVQTMAHTHSIERSPRNSETPSIT